MSFIDTLNDILSTSNESLLKLKYCLVSKDKLPYKIDGSLVKPNNKNDFVNFEDIINACNNIKEDYKGVGISIQASEICAIDVDRCFSIPFEKSSCDERGNKIINIFKDKAYVEFSFSGTGLRVLFKSKIIENYSDDYYIKNSNNHIEYYQPSNSYRYVTITGKCIFNNKIDEIDSNFIENEFLSKFMKKENKHLVDIKTTENETRTYEQLMKLVRFHYIKNNNFQDLWFTNAPGSGKDESERDYHLIIYLFENITQNKDLIKQIFESSPFFKSKDWKHVNKWNNQKFRYFNYLYDTIRRMK